MCGIAGEVDFQEPPDPDLAIAMAEVLLHRGPDESGHFADDRCALAMRRLAIQDVVHGHQPVFSEDGRIAVIFNGEIYNFKELREQLLASGHRLGSGSDTEVLPHLYEEHGVGFLHRLRGMFAVALWDSQRGRLILARDRLGKKPLFYMRHGGSLRFASEIKAFFADRSISREPDLEAIHHYLCLQYVPAPWTAFEGIRSLPPAHVMEVSIADERVERWWSLEATPQKNLDRREAAERVGSSLREAVGLRMTSDVPLGAFLSGGVDSACVVAAMAETSSAPVRTFTVGFDERERDERERARLTADALGTDHAEILVKPDVVSLLPLLAWHYDQPFADHSNIPTYIVAKETRRQVTVALNGDGGDEAFAGYERVQRLVERSPPTSFSRPLWSIARRLPRNLNPMNPVSLLRALALQTLGPFGNNYQSSIEIFPEGFLRSIYTEEMRHRTEPASTGLLIDAALGPTGTDPLWRAQLADYLTYLPGALLPKVDIATMAVSLEARSPMLDHQFVELAASLPSETKLGPEGSKLPLRDAFRGIVPDKVLDGPKRGFGLPLHEWFRHDLAPVARSLLDSEDSAVRQLIKPEAIKRLLASHESGRARHGVRIFSLISLELWFRTFIQAPPPLHPPGEISASDLK